MDNNIINNGQIKEEDNNMMALYFDGVCYLPWLLFSIIGIFNETESSGLGFFVFGGVFFLLIPTVISFVSSVIAIKKYYKSKEIKTRKAKIFNVLNIMAVVIILPYLLFCLYMTFMLIYIIFLRKV